MSKFEQMASFPAPDPAVFFALVAHEVFVIAVLFDAENTSCVERTHRLIPARELEIVIGALPQLSIFFQMPDNARYIPRPFFAVTCHIYHLLGRHNSWFYYNREKFKTV